ncbi:hypothetical protein SAMD00019534_055880 [Acytostelium subglobosum LB1]|uniref:hypothetical protein n=1 Tax=Acytostelium subglobosum LB1 TaxID=1410327 RepID=UPI0006448C75|nr:hypothetical protein SAMD00019534_055880 [Acytostelium subglobosum LB1]GAM22413.1 hypothetical protein SAMD00019534_055880 [Acytostelium subglobosum LB1]|eukprot:XP_012754533.1 hypothetical protein SAMD00019534_055880 [Acytostelium subglobosum LB1]
MARQHQAVPGPIPFHGQLRHVGGVSMEKSFTHNQVPHGWSKTYRTLNMDSERVTLTFALRLNNINELENKLNNEIANPNSGNYRQHMTRDELNEMVAPDQERVKEFKVWLQTNMDAEIVKSLPDFIVASVPVAKATMYLNTDFEEFEHSVTGKRVVRTLGPYSFHESYADLVHFIGGTVRFPNQRQSSRLGPDNEYLSKIEAGVLDTSNAPSIVRLYAGDGGFSFVMLPRCEDGSYPAGTGALPAGLCSNATVAITSFTISSTSQQFAVTMKPSGDSKLICMPCNESTNIVVTTACTASIKALGLANDTIYCMTSELGEGQLTNYLPVALNLVTTFVDSTTSAPYTTTTYTGQFLTPQVIQARYQMPMLTGTFPTNKSLTDVDWTLNSQSVAEFLEQYYSEQDLIQFFQMAGMDSRLAQRVTVVGPNNQSLPGGEASLDIQYLMGLAAGYNTTFWSLGGLVAGQEPFLEWITDVLNSPKTIYVHSVSYGDDEDSLSVDYMQRINEEFIKAGAMGMTIVFSSGDMGANSNSNKAQNKFVPAFPCSSPYVLAVGATQFSTQTTPACDINAGGVLPVKCTQIGEIASSIATGSRITSGGGFSNVFLRPSYQDKVVVDYVNTYLSNIPATYYNNTGRSYPDIAALGHNYLVVLGGRVIPVDGTSASAPVIAAVISIINDMLLRRNEKPLGFVNPALYSVGAQHPEAFFDIVMGDNSCPESPPCNTYGYPATPGYDAVTGFGSPYFPVLSQLLAPVPAPAASHQDFSEGWKVAFILVSVALFLLILSLAGFMAWCTNSDLTIEVMQTFKNVVVTRAHARVDVAT